MTDTSIVFSPEYQKALNCYSKVIAKMKDNKHVLMFVPTVHPDHVLISKMSLNVLVNITASNKHVTIPQSELGFSDFSDFLKFVNNIGYPEGGSSIDHCEQVNSYGQQVRHVILANKKGKFHLSLARPGLFTAEEDKIIPVSPDKDPHRLVAQISMSKFDVQEMVDNLSLLESPEAFGVKIENGQVTIFIKDASSEKQFTKVIDPQNVKCDPEFGKGKEANTAIRLFSASFFTTMNQFQSDFIVMVRYAEQFDLVALKAYAYLTFTEPTDTKKKGKAKIEAPIQDPEQVPEPKEPIGIMIGTTQTQKHAGITSYDVIL